MPTCASRPGLKQLRLRERPAAGLDCQVPAKELKMICARLLKLPRMKAKDADIERLLDQPRR